MLTSAAECEIASQPAAARSTAARSRMSPSIGVPGRPLRLALRAKITSSCPRAASALTTARPRYPVPPVTSTFMASCVRQYSSRSSSVARAESPASSRARRAGAPGRRAAAACRSGGSAPDPLSPRPARARGRSAGRAARGSLIARPEQTLYGRPGCAALEDQLIGAHRVAHVGEIAPGLEVADRNLRRPAPGLDVGDAPRESRGDEIRILARPEMVERPRDRHRRARRSRSTPSISCASLLSAVRARRQQRMRPRSAPRRPARRPAPSSGTSTRAPTPAALERLAADDACRARWSRRSASVESQARPTCAAPAQ